MISNKKKTQNYDVFDFEAFDKLNPVPDYMQTKKYPKRPKAMLKKNFKPLIFEKVPEKPIPLAPIKKIVKKNEQIPQKNEAPKINQNAVWPSLFQENLSSVWKDPDFNLEVCLKVIFVFLTKFIFRQVRMKNLNVKNLI